MRIFRHRVPGMVRSLKRRPPICVWSSRRHAAPAEQDRALNALVAQQCKCGWPGSGDTSAALAALVAYAAAQREAPNFTAAILLDGKPAGTAHFSGFAAPEKTFTFGSLSRGSHSVTLRKQGVGTLHYVLAYDYSLDARSPGRISGLRVRRTVRPANGKRRSRDDGPCSAVALASGGKRVRR